MLVEQVAGDVPAAGKLLPTDVIVAADDQKTRAPADLRRVIGTLHPTTRCTSTVRRGSALKQIVVRTVADPAHKDPRIIGVIVSQSAFIKCR